MPNTLNDFIKKKDREFDAEWVRTDDRTLLIDPIGSDEMKAFLRSALRECAEETVKAIQILNPTDYYAAPYADNARDWLGTNDQPHDAT